MPLHSPGRAGTGHHKLPQPTPRGTKKIALDPAESSAIDDEGLLGQNTVM